MHVVATAGHVDHGKSTLVRALTGMEPDRWAEERRRGMTIDLGYAWTVLPSGADLAFVDVPGHQKFVTNMLAGVGPAPAAIIVVAADEGWRQQTEEHVDALLALGIRHGLVVVTRSDLGDPAPVLADVRKRLRGTSLDGIEGLAVSARSGAGLDRLRDALDRLVAGLPEPDRDARVRLWIDRAFTIRGRGTVVTGTLSAGTIRTTDQLEINGRTVTVRGLQALGRPADEVSAVARVAVNLRGIGVDEVHRGDPLMTPSAWRHTDTVDVALTSSAVEVSELTVHVGSHSGPARVRPLGADTARVVLAQALPLTRGDRALLRDAGQHRIVAGAVVLDADPPPLTRRGAARDRGAALAAGQAGRLADEVRRRAVVTRRHLTVVGVDTTDATAVRSIGRWLADPQAWTGWTITLRELVDAQVELDPRRPGLSAAAVAHRLDLPAVELVDALARESGLVVRDGLITRPEVVASLGTAEPGIRALEDRWRRDRFDAPDRPTLLELQLDARGLATAEKLGRILRIDADVILPPDAPDAAVAALRELPQPFTVSEARQALATTRRVAVPLLEHLDQTGRTRRVDDSSRVVLE